MSAYDFIAQGVQPVQLGDPMRMAAAGMSLADLARRNRQGADDERAKALDRQASVLAAQGFAKVQQGSDYRTVMAELANQGEVGAYAAQKMLKVKKEDEGAQADLDLKRSTTSKNYSDADDKQFQRRAKGFGDIANAASGGADMRLLQSMSEFYGIPLPARPEGMDDNAYRQGIAATALSAKDRMQNDTTIRGQDVTADTSRRGQDLTRQSAVEGHNITARGQNMTDARQREQINLTRETNAAGKWVNDLPNGVQVNMQTGERRPITEGGQPVSAKADAKRQQQSVQAINIIDQAGPIIDQATGSYAGKAVDEGARAFGISTDGALATSKLQALEGALMMAQPRMEGPQSDKDVALYKQMAGRIGDDTVPREAKKAALAEIRKLHQKYGGGSTGGASGSFDAPAGKVFDSMPDPSKFSGKRMQADDGTIYRSNGSKWVRE